MKQKISITLEKEKIKLMENMLKDKNNRFRSISHVIEYSLSKFMEDEDGKSL